MFRILTFVIDIYILAIIVRVVMSWVGYTSQTKFASSLWKITDPALQLVRDKLPASWRLDFSPAILIILLYLVKMFLNWIG